MYFEWGNNGGKYHEHILLYGSEGVKHNKINNIFILSYHIISYILITFSESCGLYLPDISKKNDW